MKILVTGHKGYIGAVLVPRLIERGHEVTGCDADLFTPAGEVAAIPEISSDVRDLTAQQLRGFDAVVHLAALSNDPIGNLNPELTYEINYLASVRIASLAKKSGVKRFLFASSCSNYGAAGDELLTEVSPLAPVTAYGRSKVLAEQAVQTLADEDFSPVFLRNATAYGASPRFRVDLVVNNMAAWAFTTGRVRIMSDGTPWRPLVHVSDIAQAFVAAAEAPRAAIHNEIFNIGRTEENYQMRDVAEIIAKEIPGTSIEYAPSTAPDSRNYRVSFEKAAGTLPGFKPRWTVASAVDELVTFFQTAKLTVEDISGPRFVRLARINSLVASGTLDSHLRWTSSAPPRLTVHA